jgi:hypothetical protein
MPCRILDIENNHDIARLVALHLQDLSYGRIEEPVPYTDDH